MGGSFLRARGRMASMCTPAKVMSRFSGVRLRDFKNQADVLGLAKHVLLQLSCPRRQASP
eukprot:1139466-Pelagomonas_calceolata.AAC.6